MATRASVSLAFVALVVLGGGNSTAVRALNEDVAPLLGAALRFGLAALVLAGAMVLRRIPIPRGRALRGSLLFGALEFAGAFGLIHVALVRIPAGVGQVVLALVPLVTLALAVAGGLERFRWQSLAGSGIAIGGIALAFAERLGGEVPAPSIVELALAALCMAAANVVAKRHPACHPVASNAVGMALGAAILAALAAVAGEPLRPPTSSGSWLGLGYLAILGSATVFSLFGLVIARWSASSTSYAMLLMPFVAMAVAGVVRSEPVGPLEIAGGLLVAAGVYLGVIASRPAARAVPTTSDALAPGPTPPAAPATIRLAAPACS